MPPDEVQPGSPQHWLRYAQADLALARVELPPDGLYETLCFHAQQAAEKALKTVLLHRGVDFPLTQDLPLLAGLLPAEMAGAPPLARAARLTEYAVATRYPRDDEPVDESEYRQALAIAEAILTWAQESIKHG
jgi:HEPN domain-containing protein